MTLLRYTEKVDPENLTDYFWQTAARYVKWAVQFEQKLDKNLRRRIPQPWQVIGTALTHDRESLGKYLTRQINHRWTIDEYDF